MRGSWRWSAIIGNWAPVAAFEHVGQAVTVAELQWLFGFGLTFILAVAGIAVAAFRSVSLKIDRAVEKMRDAVQNGDNELHGRIDRLRQDVSDNYPRRTEMESHMARVEGTLKEVLADQKTIIRSLAALEARNGTA